MSFAEACQKSGEKQFTAPPPTIIDPAKSYTAVIKTEKGDITVELFPDVAPVTVNNFVFLACKGFYDGVTFHRVLPGFVAQTGDPTGTGGGGPGYVIQDEISSRGFEKGTLGMANRGPNTNGSQFFICLEPQPRLNGRYTVFGQVTAGMDVVESITPRNPEENPQFAGDKVLEITVEEK
ncbi:MAG: peptidylprolyl isomerase [Dehalococcoidia bacterium]|nr:peptidylprolyl isomerase [Dehalococcoidia bacterium]